MRCRRWSTAFLPRRLERGDAVIALGGGVIGDLAGFALAASSGAACASCRCRPLPLLAQVDPPSAARPASTATTARTSSGVFHQPQLVLADTEVLDTLPEREFRAGYAEVAKYGLTRPA